MRVKYGKIERFADNVAHTAKRDQYRKDLGSPVSTEHMLKKQSPQQLSRCLYFVERYCRDVGDVYREEEYRYDSDGDEPSISDCAWNASAFYFPEHVEGVGPACVREIRLDKSRSEGIRVCRAPLPDVVEVSKRVRDASEPRQNGNTRDGDTMEQH